MKELDDLIKKVGNDKVLHFLGGGWICAVITFVSILQEGDLDSWGKIMCNNWHNGSGFSVCCKRNYHG